MQVKKIALFALLVVLCCYSVLAVPVAIPQKADISKDMIVSQYFTGGQYAIFRDYNLTGDFLPWTITSGSFMTYNDAGSLLYIKQQGSSSRTGTAQRMLVANISTGHCTNYAFRMNILMIELLGNTVTFWMRLYYTDGTYTQVVDDGSWYMNEHWYNGSLAGGKMLSFAYFYAISTGPSAYVIMQLCQEMYLGIMPRLENWTIQATYVRLNTPTTFDTLVTYQSAIQVMFAFEAGGTMTMNLYPDWTLPTAYCNITSFTREGLYSYAFIAYNEWGNYTMSPVYYFAVAMDIFPKHSYLSLYNSIDGFPLVSKDFKIFLGDPDSRDLINFRSYFGNWSQLNSNGIVNASLITDGVLGMNESIDNYINISAYHNGLASPFENGMIYNTTTWTVLDFQVKVFQPTWIVIIYNPALWEKDFYLEFTENQVGYWFDVQIPFFNFTTYVDVTHNLLYELGWWIENATILLANIRVAAYYSWNGSAYVENSYRLCALENRQEPDNLIFDSPVETICIQDFFNNTLYYDDVAYTPFLDIGLPICLFTFYNWEDYSVIIRIYRGLGTFIEIVVPPHCSTTQEVFCTNYRIWIASSAMQTLRITYVSPNQTRNVIIPWGYNQTVTPPDFWEQLIEFLFHTKLGLGLFLLFCGYICLQIYGIFRRRKSQAKQQQVKEGKVII